MASRDKKTPSKKNNNRAASEVAPDSQHTVSLDTEAPTSLEVETLVAEEETATLEEEDLVDRSLLSAAEEATQRAHALQQEGAPFDKQAEAWRHVIQLMPEAGEPRRSLVEVLRNTDRFAQLADALKEWIEKVSMAAAEKVELLLELATLYKEKLRQDNAALMAWQAALQAQPENEALLEKLMGQYETMKRWPDLIALLQKKASLETEKNKKIELHERVARLFQEKFSNVAEAIKGYEQVLHIDPNHTEARAYLKASYEKRRDWEKLVALLCEELDQVQDSEQRQQKSLELARLAAEKLKRSAFSIERWQNVLHLQPDHLEALGELEKLYEREKQWEALIEVCERQEALVSDPSKHLALLQKLGLLYTERVKNVGAAVAVWQKLHIAEPTNQRAIDALKKLYIEQKDWGALQELFAQQNKYEEFVRILERQSETEDTTNKEMLWQNIGALYRDQLQKPDRALRAFEKVLLLNPSHVAAAEALIPLYETAKDNKKRAGVLRIQLDATTDSSLRVQRLKDLASLTEQFLKDKASAYALYIQAFLESDEDRESIRPQIERLAKETQSFSALASAYEQVAVSSTKDLEIKSLLEVLARVYEQDLKDESQAIFANQRLLELDAEHAEALHALERLYEKTKQSDLLLTVYRRKLELEQDATRQKELRYRMAYVLEQENDLPEAIATYQLILDSAGFEEMPAWHALNRLYRATEDWVSLQEALLQQQTLLAGNAAAYLELTFQLGALRDAHLHDIQGALACYQEIMEKNPHHEAGRRALEQKLNADVMHRFQVATILLPVYETLQAWERVTEMLEIVIAGTPEEDKIQRVALLLRLGEAWSEGRKDPAAAFSVYQRCFQEDPAHPLCRMQLEQFAKSLNRFDTLSDLYVETAKNPNLDNQLIRDLSVAAAYVYETHLMMPDQAIALYRQALEQEPEDEEVLGALERIFVKQNRWIDVLEIYGKKIEIASDAIQKAQLYQAIASVWESTLKNAEQATLAYQEMLVLDSQNQVALAALERLYAQQGRFAELTENLQEQLALTENDSQKVVLLAHLARVQAQDLEDVETAIATYQQVLALEPTHAEAIAALEAFLPQEAYGLVVAPLLENVYRAQSQWANLIGVYEVKVRFCQDKWEKIDLLQEIANCYESGLADFKAAFVAYGRAFAEEPERAEIQAQLERLSVSLSYAQALVDIYKAIAQQENTSPEVRINLWERVAQLCESQLSDDAAAEAAYWNILTLDTNATGAFDALEALYARTQNHKALIQLLLRRVQVVSLEQEKKEIYYKLADLYVHTIQQLQAATEVYHLVLALDDQDARALDALETLYQTLQNWPALAAIYERKSLLTQEVGNKKSLLLLLGEVYEKKQQNVEKAIETYQILLDLEGDNLQALQILDRLFTQQNRWEELLPILQQQVDLATDSAEQAALKHRLGEVFAQHLFDETRAIELYQEVLKAQPDYKPTILSLQHIAHGHTEGAVSAAEVLEAAFAGQGKWLQQIDALEVMVSHESDTARSVELLCKIADLYENQGQQFHEAMQAYGRAFVLDSYQFSTMEQLERLAQQIPNWPALTALYSQVLEQVQDVEHQIELLLRLARIDEEAWGNTEQAIATLQRVLVLDVENQTALNKLEHLYEKTENFSSLADVLQQKIVFATSEEMRFQLQIKLARIYEEKLNLLPQAIEAYRDILVTDASNAKAIAELERLFAQKRHAIEIADLLEPIYRLAESWNQLVQVHEAQLQGLQDSIERQALLQRLAEIHEFKRQDKLAAFHTWCRALQEQPTSELAAEETERLAQQANAFAAFAQAMREMTTKTDVMQDPGAALFVWKTLARIEETELFQVMAAEAAWAQVLIIEPMHALAWTALDRLYLKQARFKDLAHALHQRIHSSQDPDEQIGLLLRLGALSWKVLGHTNIALESYRRILLLEPYHAATLDSLENMYQELSDWSLLFDVYEKKAAVAVGDHVAAGYYAKMASIASEKLNDIPKAISLWNQVIDLRGEHVEAFDALAALYQAQSQWREWVDVVERKTHLVTTQEERISLYRQQGFIWEQHLQQFPQALDSWQEILSIDPNSLEARRKVVALYRHMQNTPELADALHAFIHTAKQNEGLEEEVNQAYIELGRLYESWLRSYDAIEAWHNVLDYQGNHPEALDALERLLFQEARYEECIDLLEKRALLANDNSMRIAELEKVARIWEDNVSQPESAVAVYRRILQLDAYHEPTVLQLERLYKTLGDVGALTDFLLERAAVASMPAQKIALFKEAAQLFETELQGMEKAFVVMVAVFQEDPFDDNVLQEAMRLAENTHHLAEWAKELVEKAASLQTDERAAGLWLQAGHLYFERLDQAENALLAAEHVLQLQPTSLEAVILQVEAYRKLQRAEKRAEALEMANRLSQNTDQKIEWLLELASLYEFQLLQKNNAKQTYHRVLEVTSDSLDALNALERIYRQEEAWVDLLSTFEQKTRALTQEEEVISVLYRMADLTINKIDSAEQAIEINQRILMIDPRQLPAMKELEALYEKTEQKQLYLEMLQKQLEVVEEDSERVSLYARIADTQEKTFGTLESASVSWERLLDIDDKYEIALQQLQRLYRAQNRFANLVDVYRRYISAVSLDTARATLYGELGRLYENEMQDLAQAIEAYKDVLSYSPNHVETLQALGNLYERSRDFQQAIDTWTHLATLLADANERAALYHRVGDLYKKELCEQGLAENYYLLALETQANFQPSIKALLQHYEQEENFEKVSHMLLYAEQHAKDSAEKVKCLYQVGLIYQNRLENEAQAVASMERALQLDPDHVEAAEFLQDFYLKEQNWEVLQTLLDKLVQRSDDKSTTYRRRVHQLLAQTAEHFDRWDEALLQYQAAYEFDSTEISLLLSYASALAYKEQWEDAISIYQSALRVAQTQRDVQTVVDINYSMGLIKKHQKAWVQAAEFLRRTLELSSMHHNALHALIEVHTAQEQFEEVVRTKQLLLSESTEEERIVLLTEIGDLYQEKLNHLPQALAAFLDALDLDPNHPLLLQKAFAVYVRLEQWKKAIDILSKLIETEPVPFRRGKLHHIAATFYQEHLRSTDEAIDSFNLALDNFFEDPKALSPESLQEGLKSFEAIDAICTARKDWQNQERNYRKMLKRLPSQGFEKIAIMLWHALGEVYRSRLKDIPAAIQAFEVAVHMDPTNLKRREILGELYLIAGPDAMDKAVAEYLEIIKANPWKPEAYRTLHKRYQQMSQYDAAWCVCAALCFLQQANAEEKQFYDSHRPTGLVRSHVAIADELWTQLLYHPNEDLAISSLFATVSQAIGAMKSEEHKRFQLNRKERRDLTAEDLPFARIFMYVAQMLRVQLPFEVYFAANQPGGFQIANTRDKEQFAPSVIVQRDVLAMQGERELAAASAVFLTKMRAEHFLRLILQTTKEMEVALAATVSLAQSAEPSFVSDQNLVRQYTEALRPYLQPGIVEHLQKIVPHFVQNGTQFHLDKWSQGVDLTSHRAALVVSGELALVMQLIQQEANTTGGLTHTQKAKELILYAVSPAYFALRKQLGLAIG